MNHLQAVIAKYVGHVGRISHAVFVFETLTGLDLPIDIYDLDPEAQEEFKYEHMVNEMKDMLITISTPNKNNAQLEQTVIQNLSGQIQILRELVLAFEADGGQFSLTDEQIGHLKTRLQITSDQQINQENNNQGEDDPFDGYVDDFDGYVDDFDDSEDDEDDDEEDEGDDGDEPEYDDKFKKLMSLLPKTDMVTAFGTVMSGWSNNVLPFLYDGLQMAGYYDQIGDEVKVDKWSELVEYLKHLNIQPGMLKTLQPVMSMAGYY